jgi:DNA-binding NarL/FixJ family response regulator
MIKVIIVDDHPVVRKGLRYILDKTSDIKVIGEAENAPNTMQIIQQTELDLDIVILDITLPGQSGLDLMKVLKNEYPKLHVLILSVHPEEQYALRLIKAGASGYLTKDNAPEELVKAIRKIAAGGKYVSERLTEKLVSEITGAEKLPHEMLSDREFQIMRLIASGKRLKEIAAALYLSEKTVSTYRTRILEKMGLKTNAELISYVLLNKLI